MPREDNTLAFGDYSEHALITLKLPAAPLSTAHAVELMGLVHRELEALEDYKLRLRWCMGLILVYTDRPYGEGAEVIESISDELWDRHAIRARKSLLYECEKLCRTFNCRYDAFARWLAEQKRILGRALTWADIQRLCLGGRSNPDVIGRDEADQRDYRDAERGIEAIERILQRAREGEEEAIGVIEGIRQSIAGMLILAHRLPPTPRSEEYVEFVRSHPCIVCAGPSESHHAFGRRGAGIKASDFTCVPLCHLHHDELHRSGRESFQARHRVNFVEVAFNLLHRYLTGAWVSLELGQRRTPR